MSSYIKGMKKRVLLSDNAGFYLKFFIPLMALYVGYILYVTIIPNIYIVSSFSILGLIVGLNKFLNAKKVYCESKDLLLITNGFKSIKMPVKNLRHIDIDKETTLYLKEPTYFGKKIRFSTKTKDLGIDENVKRILIQIKDEIEK